MKTLPEAGSRDLVWRYPQAQDGVFELKAGDDRLGWLRFDERAGERSTAEFDGRKYTFQHDGGAFPRVTVCAGDSTAIVAEYAPWLTGGGEVSFAGGERYGWVRSGIWSPGWCFKRQGGGSSVCLSQQAGPLRGGGSVRICGQAAERQEAPVLILLAWYLRVLDFALLIDAIPGVG